MHLFRGLFSYDFRKHKEVIVAGVSFWLEDKLFWLLEFKTTLLLYYEINSMFHYEVM